MTFPDSPPLCRFIIKSKVEIFVENEDEARSEQLSIASEILECDGWMKYFILPQIDLKARFPAVKNVKTRERNLQESSEINHFPGYVRTSERSIKATRWVSGT